MQPADVPAVAAIEAVSFERPWREGAFRHELDIPFSRALVAYPTDAPERVAGYVVLWHVADEVHLLNLAVAPELRGRGLGRTLATAVVEHAREVAARFVTLEVAIGNDVARTLYQRLGFVERERRRDYYAPGIDAVVMVLELA